MIVVRFPGVPLNGQIQWEREEFVHVPGQTLDAYLGINPDLLDTIVSSAVGIIAPADIAAHIPADGDEIHVVPRMGGKNKAVIAGIIGAIIGTYLGGQTALGWQLGMAAVQGGLLGYGLGSAAASLIWKPPQIKDGEKTGTQFTWQGITNADHPGVADPVVWGDTRAGGVRASAFIRLGTFPDQITGPLRTGERAHFLIYVSKDRIEEISDVRINGSPIANFPGAKSFHTLGEDPEQWYGHSEDFVTLTSVSTTATGTTILPHGFFNGQRVTISGAVPSAYNGTYAVTVVDPTHFSYTFAGGSSPATGSPLITYSSDEQQAVRPSGFDAIANTYSVSTAITLTPFIYTTQPGFLCDAVELIVAFPSGLFHGTDKGDTPNASSYKIRYRVNGTGPWTNCTSAGCDAFGVREVKRNDRAPYFEAIRIDNLTPGRYDVELTFVGADHTDAQKDSWAPFLIGVTEEQQNAPAKPGFALLAVEAVAIEALNGSIESTVIDCRCKGVWVPWHNGTSWQAATWVGPDALTPVGRNPGWLVANALRNRSTYNIDGSIKYRAWGLGDDVPEENILPLSFKAFADKCAVHFTVTPDVGSPYDEAMHSLDIVLNQQRPALELIADLLATARAARMMAGNGAQWGVFYDDEEDASQLFTMGNIVSGSLQIDRDFSARTNAFDVTFLDRDNDYEQVTREVVNKHLVETLGKVVKRDSMSLVGVTGWPNAFREASFALRKIEGIKNVIQFDARTDSILMRVGQVFNFQHERPQWGFGGRLHEGFYNNTTVVTTNVRARISGGNIFIQNTNGETLLDLGVTVWEMRVRYQDGSAEAGELRTVASAAVVDEPTGVITLSSGVGLLTLSPSVALSQAGKPWDLVAFGPVNKSVKPYRCVAITRSAVGFRHITGIEYNATIYPDAGTVEITDYSSLPRYGSLPPPITDLVAFEDLSAQNNNATTSTVKIQWARPLLTPGYGFYKGATVELSYDGVIYQPLGSVEGTTEYRWAGAPQEVPLWFRVTPFSARGLNRDGAAVAGPLTCHGRPGEFLRDFDDRLIYSYAQSFLNEVAFPTGISQTGLSGPTFGSNGIIGTVTSGAAGFTLTWNLNAWRVAFMDRFFGGLFTKALIRIVKDPGHVADISQIVNVHVATGGTPVSDNPLEMLTINDLDAHTYVVDLVATDNNTVSFIFPPNMFTTGTIVIIYAIAVGTEEFDSRIDGPMDRAQRARGQFTSDGSGGGFFLHSPVRLTDDVSNITVVDRNGIFYVNVDGNESPYKRARHVILRNVASGTFINWEDGTVIDPPIALPTAENKARILIQSVHKSMLEAAPSFYPVRNYVEATEISRSGFRLCAAHMEGGSLALFRSVSSGTIISLTSSSTTATAQTLNPHFFAGGESITISGATPSAYNGTYTISLVDPTHFSYTFAGGTSPATGDITYARNGHGARMSKHASPSAGTNDGDGWVNPLASGFATGAANDLRDVLWLSIDMPNVQRADTTNYYVDLTFQIYSSTTNPGTTNPLVLTGATDHGQVKIRCFTNGKRTSFPWVYGNNNAMSPRAYKVDWIGQVTESGGGGGADPLRVMLEKFEQHYITGTPFSFGGAATNQDLDILALEEF